MPNSISQPRLLISMSNRSTWSRYIEDMDLPEGVTKEDLFPDGVPPLDDMDMGESFLTAISEATSAEVARMLINAGADASELEDEVLRKVTGASRIPVQPMSPEVYDSQKHRHFGEANPERVNHEFWLEMIRTGISGYEAHMSYGRGERDFEMPAVWCHQRFGMSTTPLPDGGWLQIAGEHEDHYDPDFCIYNDVVIHDGKGAAQIYIYPEGIFPPTDFHSATQLDDAIILIGNLGYLGNPTARRNAGSAAGPVRLFSSPGRNYRRQPRLDQQPPGGAGRRHDHCHRRKNLDRRRSHRQHRQLQPSPTHRRLEPSRPKALTPPPKPSSRTRFRIQRAVHLNSDRPNGC